MEQCSICKRQLNNPQDVFSEDCGGDCTICQVDAEVSVGDWRTALRLVLNVAQRVLDYSNEVKVIHPET